MKLNQLTIKQASDKLKKREITSVELTKACLGRIKEVDDKVKACLTVCEEEAVKMAEQADKRRKKDESGDLLGIPCLIKDNIMTAGIKTTAASKILEDYIAPYDATVIKKLKSAGAVILGKTNLDEFAHGSSTENSAFGPTHNPHDLTRVPGGSSGGSGAAVASDMCLFALGTDTGGSVRHPASLCGITGLKPTYGRSSRYGLIAMTSSTDVPGILAKTAEDAAIVLKVIAGHDNNDLTTSQLAIPDYLDKTKKDIRGLKIGVPEEYFTDGMNKEVEQSVKNAIKQLEKLGAKIKSVSLPFTKYALPVYYIITPSEISSNLARFDGIKYGLSEQRGKNLIEIYTKTRGKGFGPEAKRRIMLGTYALSAGYFNAYYLKAQKVRTKIVEGFKRVFSHINALVTPTAPNIAFKIGEKSNDPLEMYLEDIFAVPASLAGLPAISIPCGLINNLPVGMQIISRQFNEDIIFNLAHKYQRQTDWHFKKPEL